MLLGATQSRNIYPCIYVFTRVSVHMLLFTRAVELDRARAGTGPVRTHSQWSCSCASVCCIDKDTMNYLTRMCFMRILRRYMVRRASSRRASPYDSTDKPTVAQRLSKRPGAYLYGYFKQIPSICASVYTSMHAWHMHVHTVPIERACSSHSRPHRNSLQGMGRMRRTF